MKTIYIISMCVLGAVGTSMAFAEPPAGGTPGVGFANPNGGRVDPATRNANAQRSDALRAQQQQLAAQREAIAELAQKNAQTYQKAMAEYRTEHAKLGQEINKFINDAKSYTQKKRLSNLELTYQKDGDEKGVYETAKNAFVDVPIKRDDTTPAPLPAGALSGLALAQTAAISTNNLEVAGLVEKQAENLVKSLSALGSSPQHLVQRNTLYTGMVTQLSKMVARYQEGGQAASLPTALLDFYTKQQAKGSPPNP